MMKNNTRRGVVSLALVVSLACALSACKKEQAAADGAATTPGAAETAAPTPESAVSATVAAMSPEQLRSEASKAYGESRLYAPAGNNALEYYLALRDKQPDDAGAASALTDLLPMAVIATEQGIAREDFAEAGRLAALIEKTNASYPALKRLKDSIAAGQSAAAKRAETEKLTAEQEAKRQEELAKKREEDQKKQQEEARKRLEEQQRATAATEPATPAATQPAASRPATTTAAQPVEQPAAQPVAPPPQPAAPPPRAAAASSELRAISQPGPRYPQAAQRAGAAGSVQVEFTVGTDGSVSSARVVSSDGARQFSREFEREALSAVKRWRFQPVGEPVTTRRTVQFQTQ